MPSLLISTGEPSGELYAAELVRHLRAGGTPVEVFGLGGDRMLEQGARLLAHTRDLAVVGILEVVTHLWHLRRVFHQVLAEADRVRPDAALLVDYPDFNLRLAAQLKRRGIPVIYYVSPQVWAWRPGRVKQIQQTVDRMLVLFPFEVDFYRRVGLAAEFVGHPLVDLVRPAADPAAFLREVGADPGRPTVALLPGSRPKEVRHHLERLGGTVRLMAARRPDLQFVVAVAPHLDQAAMARAFAGLPVHLSAGRAHEVLSSSAAAIVASGTATVETAILGVPMVVVYRLSPLTYRLGRPLVRLDRFAMVNLIAGREVVPELIQDDFTPERAAGLALELLEQPERAARMKADLAEVRERLGGSGGSARAAQAVGPFLRSV